MNQIMISKFDLSSIKYPSVINIVGKQSSIIKQLINNISFNNITTIFTNQIDNYKELDNTIIYNDILFLNNIVKNIIKDHQKYPEKISTIVFDNIFSLYKNYYIIPELLKINKSLNITIIIINKYAKISKHIFNYLDYTILTHDLRSSIQYKKQLYKVYGQILDNYNQFNAIYKDICQNNENKSLIIDYKQNFYIPERLLGWI